MSLAKWDDIEHKKCNLGGRGGGFVCIGENEMKAGKREHVLYNPRRASWKLFLPIWAQQPSPFKTIRGGIFVILCY